jgi:4-nitrophenyl phosphatase
VPIACDLDGVVRLGPDPIPGAAEAVRRLRAAGERVVFVTNNAATRISVQEERLEAMGIPAVGDVIGAAQAGASLVNADQRVLVVGEDGLTEAVRARGASVVSSGSVDAVVVGLDRSFDYESLTRSSGAIRAGARFIATNGDQTFPTPNGLVPGAGSIVAAIAAASGVAPEIAGKPHEPIADLVRAALGSTGLVVGDRDDTDGAFARTLGYDFALVLSGVTAAGDLPVDPAPTYVAQDLQTLVGVLL